MSSPLRVLVTGASTVLWTSWMSGPRTDYAFPRALEDELRLRGRAAEVRNVARLGVPVRELFCHWESDVLQWSPDVIVASIGHYETIHLLLPHWYERYSNRVDRRPGRLRTPWQAKVVRPAWKAAAIAQSKLDGSLLPADVRRARLQGVADHYAAYVALCQQVASPAQFVLEVLPPAPRQQAWFPGMVERVGLVNAALRATVQEIDLPHVQYVETSEIAQKLYGDDQTAATPDGFHFTPDLHREVGRALADRILDWADSGGA
jgi:lysophospholipase L1-like esterase